MIDTIQLRLHGILSKKTDTLSEIKAENESDSIFVVPSHNELYIKMLKYRGRFVSSEEILTRETKTVTDQTEGDYLHQKHEKKHKGIGQISKIMRFVDETVVREMTMRVTGKLHSPSSLHAVVFNINENGGFIDFNLSIPKYLYENSLAEFVPQVLSNRYYNMTSPASIKEQRKILHDRLMRFVKRFLRDIEALFDLEQDLDLHYTELRRIDLCFNQHFKSKSDALNYLNHQMKFAKGKQTITNNKHKEYDTSLTYFTSSGAYFKIYHKGSEYSNSKHGDLKRHHDYNKAWIERYYRNLKLKAESNELTINQKTFENIREKLKDREYVANLFYDKMRDNPVLIADEKVRKKANETSKLLKRLQPFKIDFLKAEMDKVLRYEISLRGDFFAYTYKTKVFRKDDEAYLRLKDNHKYWHSVTNSINPKKPRLSKSEIRDGKLMDKFYHRTIGLVLSERPSLKRYVKSSGMINNMTSANYDLNHRYYKYTLLGEKDVGIFCDDMLQRCLDYFFRVVKDFQVKKLDTSETLQEKIKQFNKDAEQRKKDYDETYNFLTKDIHGNQILKGRRVIYFASDLLTTKEKADKGMKKIHPLRIMQVYDMMSKGYSLHEIRKNMGINNSTFSRLKKDLERFDIFQTTLETEIDYIPEINFKTYYHKTDTLDYQTKLFRKHKFLNYG